MAERRPYDAPIWKRVRLVVLARDNYRCVDCGKPATMVDHIKPWRQGGAWFELSNLESVCRSDNVKRAYRTGGRQQGPATTSRTMKTNPSRDWFAGPERRTPLTWSMPDEADG